MKIIVYGLILYCLCTLVACGQSGDLYLPNKPIARDTRSDNFLLPPPQSSTRSAKTTAKQ